MEPLKPLANDRFQDLARIPNAVLLAQAEHWARSERRSTAELVARLAEIDRRQLYLGVGCASLFVYCVRILGLAENAAFSRMRAARAVEKYPIVLGLLARGEMSLSALDVLTPHLTQDNHRELLEAARHQPKRLVEELVALKFPRPDAPTVIRKLPQPRTTIESGEADSGSGPTLELAEVVDERAAGIGTTETGHAGAGAGPGAGAEAGAGMATEEELRTEVEPTAHSISRSNDPASNIARPAVIVPLAPGRYKIQFTISAETYQKLRRAQELLSPQVPNGDLATIFDRSLDLLLEHLYRKRLGIVKRPRKVARPVAEGSRHIPAAVKRRVWQRDEGCCAFIGRNGRRCGETRNLHFHHRLPHAVGGAATEENISLRCAPHNNYEAD